MTLVREENAITVGSLPHQTFPGRGKVSAALSLYRRSVTQVTPVHRVGGLHLAQNLCLDRVSATVHSMGHTVLAILMIYGISANS